MNPLSRRSTRENAINKEPIDSIIATKNKLDPKPAITSYDYEAVISQPDISSKIDNNSQNPSWSDSSDGLLTPTKKRNLYIRRKVNVTTKKRSTVFKSKIQTKKVMKSHPQQMCNILEIKKEPILSSEIIQDTQNFGKEKNDAVIASRGTPLNIYQVCFNKFFSFNKIY